ncbi:MAG: class I SAM-dependent methyltransferase [Candidatus Wildermuthbacteria bacterium]|nr:class I SAM-dependent methyltransferase [Candidatus Wildermuthbacteria bacterium]
MKWEERKQKEQEYYEKQARRPLKEWGSDLDIEGFRPNALSSYKFLYEVAIPLCANKMVLDYGCGNGIHTPFLAKNSRKTVGIDLSSILLTMAEKRMEEKGLKGRAEFRVMDAENLDFPDDSFDVLFDGGTFSSLDLAKALPEIVRILKPTGAVVGIETFGHNLVLNLKRKINTMTGKRTEWAASHIFQREDIDLVRRYFSNIDLRYFHIISWMAFPFLKLPGGKALLRILEWVDTMLARISLLKNCAFKVVFVFSSPKK